MEKVKVSITHHAFNKMVLYAKTAHSLYGSEISGLAPVFIEDGRMTIQEPDIMEQTCSPGNTTLTKEGMSEYVIRKGLEHKDKIPDNLMFCWWHSHHTMKAFFSGTDEKAIMEYAEKGPALAVVVNNAGEYDARYSMPVTLFNGHEEIVHFDVELDIVDSTLDADAVTKEVEELVTANRPKTVGNKLGRYTFNRYATEEDVNEFVNEMQEDLFTNNEQGCDGAPINGYESIAAYNENKEAERVYNEKEKIVTDDKSKEVPTPTFPFQPQPIPGTEEKSEDITPKDILDASAEAVLEEEKEKKPKKLKKTDTLLINADKAIDENERKKKRMDIINNINICIENYHMKDNNTEEDARVNLEYITQLVQGLQNKYSMTLHTPSDMDSITSFHDLMIQETGEYDESTYSSISKYIQN